MNKLLDELNGRLGMLALAAFWILQVFIFIALSIFYFELAIAVY